ncbi:MAG TPA: hypothetical protein VGI92_07910 [Gemmatimonadales bacterium]|jgi:hypothetical protein
MNPVHRAIERVSAFFEPRETRPGYVARKLLGLRRADDEKIVHALVKDLRARQRSDGSVGGDLVATAWFVWELLDLDQKRDSAPVQRAVKWMMSRQDKDGAYTPHKPSKRLPPDPRFAAMGGFFSYRSSGRTIARLTLPTGVTITSDAGSRFMASSLALRSVLRAGHDSDTLVRRHIGSLLAFPRLWDTWGGQWQPALMIGALSAIAWSPAPFRNQLPILAEHVALNQKPDGSWRNLDIVHAVDALVDVPLPQARESVALAAPRLAKMQTNNGSLGAGASAEERTLAALRAWLIAREYA